MTIIPGLRLTDSRVLRPDGSVLPADTRPWFDLYWSDLTEEDKSYWRVIAARAGVDDALG